jgi:hypothetical protein
VEFPHKPINFYIRSIGLGISLIVATLARPGVSQAVLPTPVAIPPYTLTELTALTPPTGATQPDDLAVSADGADPLGWVWQRG